VSNSYQITTWLKKTVMRAQKAKVKVRSCQPKLSFQFLDLLFSL
jgi:hypothetical protein